MVDVIEPVDPDDTQEPDLATADPVPDEPPKAPDPEGDD